MVVAYGADAIVVAAAVVVAVATVVEPMVAYWPQGWPSLIPYSSCLPVLVDGADPELEN